MTVSSPLACQYNRDTPYNEGKHDDPDEEEDVLETEEGACAAVPDSEGSSRRSSLGNAGEFAHKVHQQKVKQKLRQLQELMAMVQVRSRSKAETGGVLKGVRVRHCLNCYRLCPE